MNKDEIMNMQPGRELDALVAEKVFGLKVDGETTEESMSEYSAFGILLCYSTLISAAWEVVEKLNEQGFPAFTLYRYENTYVVSVYCPNGPCEKHGNKIYDGHGVNDVEGKSAPEAICKAALLSLIQVDTP